MGNYSLRADEALSGDQEFMEKLNIIKDPFEDGSPKPIVVEQKPIKQPVVSGKPLQANLLASKPKPVALPQPVITLPTLNLQGVMVGDDMHEAIIDDNIVTLHGKIDGAEVISVSKKGVGLLYKGKKFFLKVD